METNVMIPKKRAAVLTKRLDYHTQVLQGFLEEQKVLQKEDVVEINVIFVEQFDFEKIAVKVNEIIAYKPDIVVPIGVLCTQAIVHAFRERNIDIPVHFCGVTNYQDIGLHELSSEGNLITGVSLGYAPYLTAVRALLWAKPTAKSVLVPYNPLSEGGLLTTAAYSIQTFLRSRGVSAVLLALKQGENVVSVVRSKIGSVDVLMGLEGSELDSYSEELISLCEDHTVTYFSCSLKAVQKGAALGMVSLPRLVGVVSFRRVLQMLTGGIRPEHKRIILLKNEGRRMAYNLKAFARQGLTMPAAKLYMLENSEVDGNFYRLIDSEE